MLKTAEFACVFARLGLECPEAAPEDVKDPSGQAPAMSDIVVLHVPLPIDSAIRAEVEDRICPALGETEQYLDESEDEKPGSFRTVVSRKKWGTYLLMLAAEMEEGRKQVVLKSDGAVLKGKPSIGFYKDVDPVLTIQFRCKLTDAAGETSDQIRRRYVHSRLFCTLETQQTALTGTEASQLEKDVGGQVAGDQGVGTRPDALPEHSFTGETTKTTCATMEAMIPGFTWDAIRARQKSKPDQPVVLGWAELTAAAAAKSAVVALKEARAQAEKTVAQN